MRHKTGQDKTYLLAQEVIATQLNLNCKNSDPSWISAQLAQAQAWLCDRPVGGGVSGGSSIWN